MTNKINHLFPILIVFLLGSNIALAQTDNSLIEVEENNDQETPGFSFAIQCQYGFIPAHNDDKTHNNTYSFDFTVGANYWFTDIEQGFYAGARIGYRSGGLSGYYKDSYSRLITNITQYAIDVPIEVGYSFASSNKLMALSPYVGIDLSYIVGGKTKTKGGDVNNDKKVKKDLDPSLNIGVRLRLYGFNIGGAYNYQLKENIFGQREGYFSINIGYGF